MTNHCRLNGTVSANVKRYKASAEQVFNPIDTYNGRDTFVAVVERSSGAAGLTSRATPEPAPGEAGYDCESFTVAVVRLRNCDYASADPNPTDCCLW